MTLFDPEEGTRRRDEAIARAEQHAVVDWNDEVDRAILRVARRRDLFTTDDIWQELLTAPAWTHEPRAMGAAMRRAERAGWCSPTADWWLSKRPACHRRPLRVWRSLCSVAA